MSAKQVLATSAIALSGARAYRIGTPGTPWGPAEVAQWRESVSAPKRSYQEEVRSRLPALEPEFHVIEYGALSYDAKRYPLFALKSRQWTEGRPCVLVTGGVHGYETSGVQGALMFAESKAREYASTFNLVVAPCVSPWGYEMIQRWNPNAVDPNRAFHADSPAEEAAGLMKLVASLGVDEWMLHIDLHETTDTDVTEFGPAKEARDGFADERDTVPDGFYLCGDAQSPQPDFQAAVIDAVREVTHIAPADAAGKIIGSNVVQEGLILYELKQLGLCASLTGAKYTTTTEVYPDSPNATPEECNRAQVAAVAGALEFIKRRHVEVCS